MALTIKSIPILEGKSAEDFVRKAEHYSSAPTPQLSKKESAKITEFLEKSKAFAF